MLYQLTEADYPGSDFTKYYYDGLGNRTDVNENGYTMPYLLNDSGLNQYDSVDGVSLDYDDNGNVTEIGSGWYTYNYDCENRLISTGEGPEKVGCGEFTCSSGWSVGTAWAIYTSGSGKASYSAMGDEQGTLQQDVGIEAGRYYKVTIKIDEFDYEGDDEGVLDIYLGTKLVAAFTDGTAGVVGTHTFENVKAEDAGNLKLTAEALYDYYIEPQLYIDIDYISVKREDASYKYDFAGRRVAKTFGSVTTKYCYDRDQVIAEYENDVLKRKFIYGPGIDEPVCMIDVADSNKKYYYHFDGLGSVIALLDSSANVVERYSYDVFGDPNRTSNVNNPYYFTARRYDTDTGLYYYRARYYNPDLGRFMQTDPTPGLNLYTYCWNNPLNYKDPYGKWPIWPCIKCWWELGEVGKQCNNKCRHICDEYCDDYEAFAECMEKERPKCIEDCINLLAGALESCARCAGKSYE